jgi:hypothetical protein
MVTLVTEEQHFDRLFARRRVLSQPLIFQAETQKGG